MKRSKFTGEQVVYALKQAEAGIPIEAGISVVWRRWPPRAKRMLGPRLPVGRQTRSRSVMCR